MTHAHAQADAAAAAQAAGVTLQAVSSPAELAVLRATMDAVWGPEVVPPRNLLRGLALGGAGLLVASADDEPVGFALGWLGWHQGVHFHSHQVGVRADARGTGAGVALKLAQRAQCLQHGIAEMRWTFDPLLAVNATFNLVKLGARVIGYLPNCYGERTDAFNTGDVTDRLEVSWALDAPVGGAFIEAGERHVVPVPAAYQQLRSDHPADARRWRTETGDALAEVFRSGGTIVGLARHEHSIAYVTDQSVGLDHPPFTSTR